jgi:uncharacterized repeat protein (TIGR03833 family)
MAANSFNPNFRRDVLPGMYVYILTDKGETSEGIVADVLGIAEHHSDGIKVRLQSGIVGRTKQIQIPKDNALKGIRAHQQLEVDLKVALTYEENDNLEYKGSFAFDSDNSEHPKKFLQKEVAKTIQAFANSEGGRLYIGIHDKTHEPLGLLGDYSFLPEGKQDADGFEIYLRGFLKGKFLIGTEIFNSVKIVVFQYKSQDVCFVDVEPSDVAFVLKNDSSDKIFEFHVREGGNSPPKTITEFLNYWPNHLEKMRKKKLEIWSQ